MFAPNTQIVYPGNLAYDVPVAGLAPPHIGPPTNPRMLLNSSRTTILKQLLVATVIGAFLPIKSLIKNSHIKPEQIPVHIFGFGAVGFCAGAMWVLNDIAQNGTAQSKSRGDSVTKWHLLKVLAACLVIPVLIGFCMLVLMFTEP